LRIGPPDRNAMAYGSGVGLVPAARAALTSARAAVPRSAAACDGVRVGGALGAELDDDAADDELLEVERGGASFARFEEPEVAAP